MHFIFRLRLSDSTQSTYYPRNDYLRKSKDTSFFSLSWTLNGIPVDTVIAVPSLHGAKLKAFATHSTFPAGTCELASNEVTFGITSLPAAPSHAVKLVKGCVGLPFSLNATGCSPSLTFWYNSAGVKIGEGSRLDQIVPFSGHPVLNLAVKGLCLAGLKQSCILFLHHR
jgi:hypothetical protein